MLTINANTIPHYNIGLAYDIGMAVPEPLFLGNHTAEELDMVANDRQWDIIIPGKLALKHINGLDVTFSMFWNGDKYSCFTTIINERGLLNGNQGPELDANCVTAFASRPEPVTKYLKNLSKALQEKEPDWKGFINLDVSLTGGKAYYKRIAFGTKYDYIYAMSELNNLPPEEMVTQIETGIEMDRPDGYGVTTRVYVYPYEPTDNLSLPLEMHRGTESFVLSARGETIKDAWKTLYRSAPRHPGACYRTDGQFHAQRVFSILKKERYL